MPAKRHPTIAFEASPALIAFRRTAGNANRCLNTLLVGLETMKAHDPIRPNNLVLSWSKPTTQAEWDNSISFALKMTLVAVIDGLDQFMRVLARVPGLADPALGDALSGRKETGAQRRLTVAERLEKLSDRYPKVAGVERIAAIHLLMNWRNAFVHNDYRFDLHSEQRKALKNGARYFRIRHSGVDILEALERYDRREPPTLSNLSTLISATQLALASLDGHLLHLQDGPGYADALLRFLIKLSGDPEQFIRTLWRYGQPRLLGRIHFLFVTNGGNHDDNRRQSAPQLTWAQLRNTFGFGLKSALLEYGS